MGNFVNSPNFRFNFCFLDLGFFEPHHLYIFEKVNVKANVKPAKENSKANQVILNWCNMAQSCSFTSLIKFSFNYLPYI